MSMKNKVNCCFIGGIKLVTVLRQSCVKDSLTFCAKFILLLLPSYPSATKGPPLHLLNQISQISDSKLWIKYKRHHAQKFEKD